MAEAVTQAVARQAPASFKLGKKAIYLPNHVVTLLRKNSLPPNWAMFHVPLRFTKFDLRDYLWNLYGVEATAVRAVVKQQGVQRKHPKGGFYRPQSQKFMTIQMADPFVWPQPPKDLEPWNKKMWEAREAVAAKHQKADYNYQLGKRPYLSKEPLSAGRIDLREKAKALLKGEKTWEGPSVLDSKWDSIVEAEKSKKAEAEES